MTIKLISLVIITLFLLSGHSYSEEQFLFPKKKPSIFKNIKNSNKIDLSKNLPQRKPFINKEEDIEKDKEVKKKIITLENIMLYINALDKDHKTIVFLVEKRRFVDERVPTFLADPPSGMRLG